MPPPVLNTTPGDPGANSYASLVDFRAYWDAQPNNTNSSLSDANITVLLIAAAAIVDESLQWTGAATLAGIQALCWPRQAMVDINNGPIPIMSIPQRLINSQCQQAGDMNTTDVTAPNVAQQQGISSLKAGPVEIHYYDKNPVTNYQSADAAIRVQGPEFMWVKGPLTPAARYILVPSWYVREGVMRPIIFEGHR